LAKPIPWKQVAERDAFLKGSDCRRIEKRLQSRFNKKLISIQNESKDLEIVGKYRHLRFRKLIDALAGDTTYQSFDKTNKKFFISYIIDKYRLFKTHDAWIESIIVASENEVWFQNNRNFWKIPYSLVSNWFKYIVDHQLLYYESSVLLALIIVVTKYVSLNKKPPIIQLTCKLTGFEPKTVNRSIDLLRKNGVIKYSKANKYSSPNIELADWFEQYDSSVKAQPSKTIVNWGKNLVDLGDFVEFQWLGYMYALPFSLYNPFIAFIYPNLLIHQTMLNTNLLIFSLFDKKQIRSLYKIWVTSNYTRAIDNRYRQAKKYIKKKLDQSTAVFSSKHYKQIYRCSPILHFVAKRKRMIDFQVLYDNLYVQDALQKIHKKRLINVIEFGNINREYFMQCLESGNFVKAWKKKYNIEDINPAVMFIDNIPDSIKGSFIHDMGDLYKFPLRRYLDAQKNYVTLKGLLKFLEKNNINTLDSNYNCLRIKTHRVTFSHYPIQSIRKQVRSVIKAPPGKVFLHIDLASAQLAILKWFVLKYQNLRPDSLVNLDHDYITDLMNLDRSLIKKMTFPFLYGASIETMRDETSQSEEVVKEFRKIMLEFPGIGAFRKKAIDYAKKNHISLPTALGHQFPVFGDPYTQGLSFCIQGSEAELLRQWLLEIHKTGIAMEISNVVHDEIILEVEEKLALNRATLVNSCLEKATSALFPGITIDTKTCISHSWDKSGLSLSQELLRQLT